MDVAAWLKEHGLEEYAEAFAENGVDAGLLPELSNEDLKDLGIARLADRKRLLRAIAQLSEGGDHDEATPSPTAAFPGERRQVTVLFADIAGYTKLSSELGAEETHALLNHYFEAVDGIVQGYGGSVDKHMGDNVMAVFGAPIAHDNDPLRAVRAALDIHERMAALPSDAGHPLQAHVGIASGQVVASGTGSDAHREYTVTGDSVNLASRLQDKAEPGETLICDALRRAVADGTDCDSLGDVSIKGLDAPVRVWRVKSLRGADEASARVAFVGRRAELAQFSGVVEVCRRSGNGQAIVVRGEAGIGKTRLVEEFTRISADQGFVAHKGLVLDFGVGKGQDAIRSVVRSLLEIAPGGDKAARQAATEAALADGLLTADQRVFLYDLLDLPQPIEDRAMYDAMDNATRNNGKRDVVAGLIRAVSARAPILIIVEDVHWADPLMLTHLALMTATVANCPTVLVMTSRIEGDPLDHAWRSATRSSSLMTIDLGSLREEDAIAMASAFIDATNQFALRCVERAEGNPLFLEQLLRSAEEREDEEVPASIQSLVLSRMDRLPTADKRALKAAAVIGQRFVLDTLCYLLDEADYTCAGLIEHYLVRPEDDYFLFAHALIQEGVYASLLKATRCGLHVRAAEWFADRDPVLHAQHLDRGEDTRAAIAYLVAAKAQASNYRYERAVNLVERGLDLTTDAVDKHALTSLRGKLLRDLGSVSESIDAYRLALNLAANDEMKCQAWVGLAAGMRVTDDYDGAFEALDSAEKVATTNGFSLELSRIHQLRGNLYFPLGRVEDCHQEHELALEFAQQAVSPESEARALSGLGDAEYARGRMFTAYDYFLRCIELCRDHRFVRIEVANLGMLGHSRMYLNDLELALNDCLAAINKAARVGHHRAELVARRIASFILFDMDELARAREEAERALTLAGSLGARRFVPDSLTCMAKILRSEAQHSEAVELLDQAIAISRETGFSYTGPRVLGELALATDDAKVRQTALNEGEDLLRAGSVSHNHFWFYRDAMQAALVLGDWEGVGRYAKALEDYTRCEPLPWTDFFIAQGRTLAAHGQGKRDPATMHDLKSLRDEAERVGMKSALPALEEALTTV